VVGKYGIDHRSEAADPAPRIARGDGDAEHDVGIEL
jgi:hypothetical protein